MSEIRIERPLCLHSFQKIIVTGLRLGIIKTKITVLMEMEMPLFYVSLP